MEHINRWEAIVFASPPISLFEGALLGPAAELKLNEEAVVGFSASSLASEPSAAAGWSKASQWEKKYRVKYKVKQLVGELMECPVGCSTPRPGVNIGTSGSLVAANGLPWEVEALVKKVLVGWDQPKAEDEKELVERYVHKYFFKLKMKGDF